MTIGRIIGGLLIVSLAGAGAVLSTRPEEKSSAPEESALPVRTIEAMQVTSFVERRHYSGVLETRRSSVMGFERSGRIEELVVDEGDQIEVDQVLGRLDTRHLDVAERDLKAQRTAAFAKLSELKAGPRQETIRAARATVGELTALLRLQERSHTRTERLHRTGALTQQALDESTYGTQAATARVEAAVQQLRELEAGTRIERITAQEAVVAQLDAALAKVRLDRQDSVLTAPFAGRIAERFVDEGTVISIGAPVVRLLETSVLQARIGLPVAAAAQLTNGESVTLSVGGLPWQASVARVRPEVDLRTRTQLAVFELHNVDERVAQGQVVRFESAVVNDTTGFWLPSSSLTPSQRGLWSVNAVMNSDGQEIIERRSVEILHTDGNQVLVRGTISDGDLIVAAGIQRVVPGQVVITQPTLSETSQRLLN